MKIQISGNNKDTAELGFYNFSSIKFIALPDYNTTIKFTSDALDLTKI